MILVILPIHRHSIDLYMLIHAIIVRHYYISIITYILDSNFIINSIQIELSYLLFTYFYSLIL